jgi:hypothetical protein
VLELWPGWSAGGGDSQYPHEGGGGQYPPGVVAAAMSEAAWLRQTLPMPSRVVGPYKKPVT